MNLPFEGVHDSMGHLPESHPQCPPGPRRLQEAVSVWERGRKSRGICYFVRGLNQIHVACS